MGECAWRPASVSGNPDDLALAEFEAGLTQSTWASLSPASRWQTALAHFQNRETYVPMMLNYGQALAVAGAADAALKVYADAGQEVRHDELLNNTLRRRPFEQPRREPHSPEGRGHVC
jgi:hypothetical protein